MATDITAINNNNTWGRSNVPTSNLAGTTFNCGWRNDPLIDHGWIDFTLPSGIGSISKITLFCFMDSNVDSQTQSIQVFQLSEAFITAQATWNNRITATAWSVAGGTTTGSVIHATNSPATGNWQSWDLVGGSSTNPVAGLTWGSNIKLLLKRATESGTTATYTYGSGTYGTSADRPYIEITYTSNNSGFLSLM